MYSKFLILFMGGVLIPFFGFAEFSFNDLVQQAYLEASKTNTMATLQLKKGELYNITQTCILDKPIRITGPEGKPFPAFASTDDGALLAKFNSGPALRITSEDVYLSFPDFAWDTDSPFPLIEIDLPKQASVHIEGGTLEVCLKGIALSGGSCYIVNTVFLIAPSHFKEPTAITANLSPGYLDLQNTQFLSSSTSFTFFTACFVECLGDVAVLSISNEPDNQQSPSVLFTDPYCKSSVQITVQPTNTLPPPKITFLMDHVSMHGIEFPIAIILPDELGLQYFETIALSNNQYENDPPDHGSPELSSSWIHFLKDVPGLPAVTPIISPSTKLFIPQNPQAQTSNSLPYQTTLFNKWPIIADALTPLEKTTPKLSVKTTTKHSYFPSHVQLLWQIDWEEEPPITHTDIQLTPQANADINLDHKTMTVSSSSKTPVKVTLTPKYKHAIRTITAGEEQPHILSPPQIIRFQP